MIHKVEIKKMTADDLPYLRELLFDGDMAWKKYDAPYFPIKIYDELHLADFIHDKKDFFTGEFSYKILVDKIMVGSCVAYYEDGDLKRWLEVGITIMDSKIWGKGVGYLALRQLINECFNKTDLPHLSLTTWSGNPRMMALAIKLGFRKEGCLRKVRYWEGKYWDCLKYGILKEEWRTFNE